MTTKTEEKTMTNQPEMNFETIEPETVSKDIETEEVKSDNNKPAAKNRPVEREEPKAPVTPKKRAPKKKGSGKSEIDEAPVPTLHDMTDRKIISASGTKRVITEQDRYNAAYLELINSYKSGKVMIGNIESVEPYAGFIGATLHHGPFKVVIPSHQLIERFPKFDPRYGYKDENHMIRVMMEKRIGAEIEYVVLGDVDTAADVAVASRVEAMKQRRYYRYIRLDPQGKTFMYEGAKVESRVQAVVRTGIYVEIQGVETFIPNEELSYKRITDAADIFSTGDMVLALVQKIEIDEDKNIRVSASVKAAETNPLRALLPQLQLQSAYGGTITMITEHGVFVELDNGVECLCRYPKFGRTPTVGAKALVRLTVIEEKRLRVLGVFANVYPPKGE